MFQRDWLILRDTSGTIVARFDDWISFEIRRRMNDIDTAILLLDGNNNNTLLFGLDYIIEFWRENKEANIAAYREGELFHRTFKYSYDKNGQLTFMSKSVGFDDLLKRRIIYNYAGDARTDKSGAAESVMKEFANEQAGPSATVAAGRIAAGDFTGLSIEADAAAGDTWDGARSWRNLLEVEQEIAESMDMAFHIDSLDLDTPTFIFRAYERPYGADRSSTGIVAATGRNSAGNYPVVFSDQFDTFSEPSYGILREDEANVAIVLGRGNEEDRNVREKTLAGTSYDTDSPWNRREIAIHATQEISDDSLDRKGDEVLQQTIPQTIVDGKIIQHPSLLYGRDYFLGDVVTTRVSGLEVNRTISEVTIKVQGKIGQFAESIDIELAQ